MTAKNYWIILGRDKYPALYEIAKPINEMICSSAIAEQLGQLSGLFTDAG